MRKGETKSGFKFEIDEEIMDDMEFIELLAAAQKNELLFPEVIEQIMGKEQKRKLYDHLRNEKGRVPVDATIKVVEEIMVAAGEDTKNS